MEEKTIFPIAEEELPSLVAAAHGFVAGKLSHPFGGVEVKIVSQAELGRSLEEMIREVREIAEKDDRAPRWMKDLVRYGGERFSSSFVRLLSGRILGLYTQSYKSDAPGRLLLVGQNIEHVASELGLEKRDFFLWVLIHETMHVAQFNTPGSYLREKIRDTITRIGEDRQETKKLFQEASTTMTWIEGSADAMMDEPGLLSAEQIGKMREKIEERRNRVSWSSILLQILTRKNTQYREGRRFSQEVSKKYGMEPMGLIIRDPQWLPTAEEIKSPSLWIQRYEKDFLGL